MKYILDNIDEGIIIIKSSGKIVHCNSSALRFLKFSEKEILQKNICDIIIDNNELESEVYKKYELKNRFNDVHIVYGKFVPTNLKNENLYSFIFKVEEINMKKLSERLYYELKKNRETEVELEVFLSTAVDCMTMIDENGVFKKVDLDWKTECHWSEEELKKFLWMDVVHPDDIEEILKKAEAAKKNNELVRSEGRFKNRNGEWIYLETSTIFDKDKGVFINTSKDITEKKKIEKERRKYERLKELENVKTDFFANVSHEFKTPLNLILSFIQLIDYSIENNMVDIEPLDKFKRYIQGIRQNSFRLLRLSNNIIDMTKIDSGFFKLRKTNCNIVNILDKIVESISDYVENKGIELAFDPECEEVITACDEGKLERIILNLISNSIKYIEGEGRILIKLTVENNCVVISVEDNGIGISDENLEIVFERFKQIDSIFTRRVEGSGIGLSLVKSLVEMHNGEIYIKSKVGVGTKVIFYLPIMIMEEEDTLSGYNNINEVWQIEFSDIYD